MQTVDLVITDIDWLITVDPARRIIRDAAIAVDGGKIVAVGKTDDIAAKLFRRAPRRRPATRWRRRGSSTATCMRRFSCRAGWPTRRTRNRSCSTACIPTRRHSKATTFASSATLAGSRAAQARRHLLHRSGQLSSRGVGRGRDVDRHPLHRVALVVRSDQIGARHTARAHDRVDRGGAGARRRRCSSATPSRTIRGSAPAPRFAG